MDNSTATPDRILGEEFLTWLWFASDTNPDGFKDADGQPFSIFMEQRIVVQGGEGQARETASVSGCLSALREARLGVATGKKVTRALIRLEKDGIAFQLTLKSEDSSITALKTPKLDRTDDEPDSVLLEKVYLVETCLHLIDNLYAQFLKLRLSDKWLDVVEKMLLWLENTDTVRG